MPSNKYYLFLLLLILTTACQQATTSTEGETEEKTPTYSAADIANIKITPCSPLPAAALHETVSMQTYTYERGKMMFGVRNLRLGGRTPADDSVPFPKTNKGTYLHLNIDNQQHQISNNRVFDYQLDDGAYKLFAFINRSYHISIKNPTAIIAKEIKVRNQRLHQSKDLTAVDVVYNMPRGEYEAAEAEKVILDFVLVNTTIAEGQNKVRVTIDNGAVFEIKEWQPYYISGLKAGKHHCKLELLNANGQQITAPAEHTFTVKAPKTSS